MTESRHEPTLEPGVDVEQALAAFLAAQRMSRRQLLERIAAVGAAAALAPVIAACASGPMADAERARLSGSASAPVLPVAPAVLPGGGGLNTAPVQAAAASSHVIARIIARIVARG